VRSWCGFGSMSGSRTDRVGLPVELLVGWAAVFVDGRRLGVERHEGFARSGSDAVDGALLVGLLMLLKGGLGLGVVRRNVLLVCRGFVD